MLRRSLLTTFVTLIAGALAPSIPVAAGPDPAAFINNLAYQLHCKPAAQGHDRHS
jgi:hypothetical protein